LAVDRHFIEEVIPGRQPPLSTLDDALFAQIILDAAEESCESGMHVLL